VHARAVTRIQEVRTLRVAQFPEDAGPMAHPIRPASYAEINNFYTATVYEKGAQVIRMIETLIGRDNFRLGMDMYFQRHDGQAVTCEDFVQAMQDAAKIDLTQFRRWYARAGTPRLHAAGSYDAAARRFTLTLTQTLAPTAYEKCLQEAGIAVETGPLHIPVAVGLVLPDGQDAFPTRVLSLTETTQTWQFDAVSAPPVASVLRGFSAPVLLDFEQSDAELAHLMAHDSDALNRWEAGQRLATRVLLAGIAAGGAGTGWIPDSLVAAFGRVLDDALRDPAFVAEVLNLPAEPVLAEEVVSRGWIIDPEAIFLARLNLRRHLAARLQSVFETLWQALAPSEPYAPEGAQVGRRALRNSCLAYLAEIAPVAAVPRLLGQLEGGGNMTDVAAALGILANFDVPERDDALGRFYARWQHEALVVDKWLQVQATARLPDTGKRVRELMSHPAFDLKNPNKVYALVRAFCGANPRHFHAADGSGYALAADVILELQALNPQVASRIARSFDRWRLFDAVRQAHARTALEHIQACTGLAKDVAEVVGNALR
jgi:aminopeptidase N